MPTKRNIDLLSNKEMFVKYASVVEFVRNAKITIIHSGGQNKVQYKGDREGVDQYTIWSATPNVEGIEKLIGIIHELAHVLFESPFLPTTKLIKQWQPTAQMHAIYFNMFNVLEDQRIESHMGKMYLKHGDRFMKTRTKLGLLQGMNLKFRNPVNLALGIRFNRDEDLINRTEYYQVFKDALDNVEFTDKFGALRVLISLKPIIDKMMKEINNRVEELTQHSQPLTDSERSELTDADMDNNVNQQRFNSNRDRSNDVQESELPEELEDSLDMSEEEIENMIEDSKEAGQEIVNEIYAQLRGNNEVDKTPSGVVNIKRLDSKYTVNYPIARGLIRVFKHLMMRHKEFIDYEGDEVDVEAYVEGVIRGNDMSNCRINKRTTHGASIVVSIDGSGSMSYCNRIETARNLVATMYESIKNLDNVELRANVWSGNSQGQMGVTEINNAKEVKSITLTNRYYSTPTHIAFEYSANMLKEMKGSKKLMIVITDGQPAYSKNGFRIPDRTYLKMCKKSLLKARCVTNNIVCILVGGSGYRTNTGMMGEMLKPSNLMVVDNMESASETVIKRFKQMVIRSLV